MQDEPTTPSELIASSRVWDDPHESLDSVNARIHDGVPINKLNARALRYVKQILDRFPYNKIDSDSVCLEIGSGTGFIMEALNDELKRRGRPPNSIIGLDIAKNMSDRARSRLGDNSPYKYKIYDGIDIPQPQGSLDLIYSVAALQHIPKPFVYNLFLQMHRLLKPSGMAVFSLLSFKALPAQEKSGQLWRREIYQQVHGKTGHWLHYYSKEELSYVLRTGTGFNHVDVQVDSGGVWVCMRKTSPSPLWRLPGLSSSIGWMNCLRWVREDLEIRTAERRRRRNAQLINSSGLFDTNFYFEQRPDIADAGVDPIDHYLKHGAAENMSPSMLFDTRFYTSQCADIDEENPLVHFIRVGATLGRNPHPLFDTGFYVSCYGAKMPTGMNPLAHFLTLGGAIGFNPHPLFNSGWYMSQFPDVRFDRINPLVHYLTDGWRQGAAPHQEFDGELYLKSNPDVRAAGTNPLEHFLRHGRQEGRSQPKPPR